MLKLLLILGGILLAIPAYAQPQTVPWTLTGTSSAPFSEAPPIHRVENRLFSKEGRFHARLGFSYFSRGDFYRNPGLAGEVSWYPLEQVGIDLAATGFFSSLGGAATTLRRTTGLLPDAQQPVLRLVTGPRFSFAYGKVLLESLDLVAHFDFSTALHLGVLLTDQKINPGGELSLAFQLGLGPRLLAWLEAGWFGSYEKRTMTSFSGGVFGTLGLGVRL